MGRKGKAADSGPNADEGSSSDCLPCRQGCAYCKDDTPCVAQEDGALRMAVLSFQCLCMLVVFISMLLIYHFRRNKVSVLTHYQFRLSSHAPLKQLLSVHWFNIKTPED